MSDSTMVDDTLLADVAGYIERNNHVSFAELARRWPADFHDGDRQIVVDPFNIVLWQGLSARGVSVFHELESRYEINPASWLSYLIDGMALRLPLAKRKHAYKKPHWLPVVFAKRRGRTIRRRA